MVGFRTFTRSDYSSGVPIAWTPGWVTLHVAWRNVELIGPTEQRRRMRAERTDWYTLSGGRLVRAVIVNPDPDGPWYAYLSKENGHYLDHEGEGWFDVSTYERRALARAAGARLIKAYLPAGAISGEA